MENTDMQGKLTQISKDVQSITKKATAILIETAEQMEGASEFLKQVVVRKKRIEELRIFFTKPLNDHIRDINAQFKKAINPLEAIEKEVKGKMVDYRRIENERIEKERMRKLKEAEKLKTESLREERIEEAEKIQQETKVETASGSTRFKKVWKFEVLEEAEVPRAYLEVNESLIRRAVADGVREIPGVRIYEDEIPSVY